MMRGWESSEESGSARKETAIRPWLKRSKGAEMEVWYRSGWAVINRVAWRWTYLKFWLGGECENYHTVLSFFLTLVLLLSKHALEWRRMYKIYRRTKIFQKYFDIWWDICFRCGIVYFFQYCTIYHICNGKLIII